MELSNIKLIVLAKPGTEKGYEILQEGETEGLTLFNTSYVNVNAGSASSELKIEVYIDRTIEEAISHD